MLGALDDGDRSGVRSSASGSSAVEGDGMAFDALGHRCRMIDLPDNHVGTGEEFARIAVMLGRQDAASSRRSAATGVGKLNKAE